MTEVNTDYGDYKANTAWKISTLNKTPLNERADADTISKVKSLPIPCDVPQMTAANLDGRVSNARTQPNDLVLHELENFGTSAAALTPPESSDKEASYAFQIRTLIAKILVQLNRISQKDRDQINKLKIEYKRLTKETAGFQRQLGRNNLFFAVATLGVSLFQIAENPVDKNVAKMFAEHVCPKVGEMFGSGIQANTTHSMNLSNLLLQEYQSKSSKGQSDSSNKQELTQMLDRALNGLTQAARAG